MAQLLMTGFPGFLGSALLPRLLARRPDTEAVCLVQHQHAVLAQVAGQGARDHRPPHDGPDPAHRGRHHRRRAGPEPGRARAPRRRARGVAPGGRLRPGRARGDRAPGQRRGHRQRARVLPRAAGPAPPAVRQHLLRERPLRGRLPRGLARGGAGVPQPLRGDQVRGRAARAQGDGRRRACHHLPPGHRRGRLRDRRHPEVRRPLLPRHVPRAPAGRGRGAGRRRRRHGAGLPRAA